MPAVWDVPSLRTSSWSDELARHGVVVLSARDVPDVRQLGALLGEEITTVFV